MATALKKYMPSIMLALSLVGWKAAADRSAALVRNRAEAIAVANAIPLPPWIRSRSTQLATWNLVTREIAFESERLRYSIEGKGPYIDINSRAASAFNRTVRRKIIQHYRSIIHPNLKELRQRIRSMPEIPYIDTAEFDYEVLFQNSELLSIRFHGPRYSYPKAHEVTEYFSINYDLKRSRPVWLKSLFSTKAKVYRRLTELCAREFRAQGMSFYYEDGSLEPSAYNYIRAYLRHREKWNITDQGLVFNFDQCTIPDCAHGAPSVTIPFTDVVDILRHNTPVYGLTNNRR